MNLILVDDHPLFLEGLKNLLTARGVNVVAEARNGYEAVELARQKHPEVILMDIQMPVMDGLAATRLIKSELPDTQIIMLTMSEIDDNVFEAIKSGASGYLIKTQDSNGFFSLLEKLEAGEVALSPGIAARILREFGRLSNNNENENGSVDERQELTSRQIEVLKMVSEGLTYKEVAARLHISERTVKYYMGEILKRLHMENRSEVIRYARRMGYTNH
jgi:DNA-binding NarL/FixJ family response regulator